MKTPDLTTTEAAARLGLSHETVRRYINRGLLRGYKRGRDWFILQSELERFMRTRRRPGRPANLDDVAAKTAARTVTLPAVD